tara:strand:+ start:4083 stop:4682 length:600 start_codon:yes stop_codon:yes gene_type:complete
MPVAISGDGTITGLSVGGLPNGIVDADMLAANAVTAEKISSKTFTSYAIICDKKAYNVQGGSATAGAWHQRDLNHEIADPDGIVSISNNHFVLQAGTYLIKWKCPGYAINRTFTELVTVASSGSGTATRVALSNILYMSQSGTESAFVTGTHRITIGAETYFAIKQHAQSVKSGNGLGVKTNLSGNDSIYTIVEIYKEA